MTRKFVVGVCFLVKIYIYTGKKLLIFQCLRLIGRVKLADYMPIPEVKIQNKERLSIHVLNCQFRIYKVYIPDLVVDNQP